MVRVRRFASSMSPSSTAEQIWDPPLYRLSSDVSQDAKILPLVSINSRCIDGLGCQFKLIVAIGIIAKRMKLNVSGISYRIKGVWDNSAFLGESDVPTHFQELTLEVEIESPDAIPPQSLKQLQETVDRLCPVSSLIHAAGTKVSSIWTLKQTTTPK